MECSDGTAKAKKLHEHKCRFVLEETEDSADGSFWVVIARLAYAYIDFTEDWQANRVKSVAS